VIPASIVPVIFTYGRSVASADAAVRGRPRQYRMVEKVYGRLDNLASAVEKLPVEPSTSYTLV
jgi:hypothetical protein